MRKFATPALLLFALALGFQQGTPARAQSATVLKEQAPAQAEQSRARDRSQAENVRIGRNWKAHDKAGRTNGNSEHVTVGRDWRAHAN